MECVGEVMSSACCGFGHRNLFCNIEAELQKILETLIVEKGVDIFYTGAMGEFDTMFGNSVRFLKKKYTNISIILVKPYFSNELNINKTYYTDYYDDIIIFEDSEKFHPKSAINYRNRWLVDKSAYIIGCIYHKCGGAYTALRYAEKQNKKIIMLNLKV